MLLLPGPCICTRKLGGGWRVELGRLAFLLVRYPEIPAIMREFG